MVGWCSMGTFNDPCMIPNQPWRGKYYGNIRLRERACNARYDSFGNSQIQKRNRDVYRCLWSREKGLFWIDSFNKGRANMNKHESEYLSWDMDKHGFGIAWLHWFQTCTTMALGQCWQLANGLKGYHGRGVTSQVSDEVIEMYRDSFWGNPGWVV